jgi:hypothetical protein
LNLPSAPNIDSREFEIKNVNADGAPKMFFACHHINENGNHEFYVGANQADWEGLESIADIRRADRDCRLARYIPLAERAYNALHEAEMKVQLPNSMAYMDDKERLYQIRLRAVAAMKNPPNLDFLGRKSETGQAFDKRLKVQQCCYVCHGMMGYHIPKRFKDREVRSYLCHHNWAMRAGYAHSCAEIVVSLQCAQNWMSNGKSPKF